MAEAKKYTKEELVALAKKNGFFKKESVKEMWARENGHFYYQKPPKFIDGLESYRIKREECVVKAEPKKETKPATKPAAKKEPAKKETKPAVEKKEEPKK